MTPERLAGGTEEGPEDKDARIAQLETTIDSLLEELRKRAQEVHEKDRQIEELKTDPLMKIPNRRAADEKIASLEDASTKNEHDAVLLLDIDNFKIVNDAFKEGHAGGDRILEEAGQYLKEQFRESDFISRWGGEEILVFLSSTDVKKFMERPHLGFTTILDGEEIPITFSGGLTVIKDTEHVRDAIKRADEALYQAKEDVQLPDGSILRGRNRILLTPEQAPK